MKITEFPQCDASGDPISGEISFYEAENVGCSQKLIDIYADAAYAEALPNPLPVQDGQFPDAVFVKESVIGFEVKKRNGDIVMLIDGITDQPEGD